MINRMPRTLAAAPAERNQTHTALSPAVYASGMRSSRLYLWQELFNYVYSSPMALRTAKRREHKTGSFTNVVHIWGAEALLMWIRARATQFSRSEKDLPYFFNEISLWNFEN